jgi:hypothetical protein
MNDAIGATACESSMNQRTNADALYRSASVAV